MYSALCRATVARGSTGAWMRMRIQRSLACGSAVLEGVRARAWRLLARGRVLFAAGNDGKPPFGKGHDETAANRFLVPPVQRIGSSSVG